VALKNNVNFSGRSDVQRCAKLLEVVGARVRVRVKESFKV